MTDTPGSTVHQLSVHGTSSSTLHLTGALITLSNINFFSFSCYTFHSLQRSILFWALCWQVYIYLVYLLTCNIDYLHIYCIISLFPRTLSGLIKMLEVTLTSLSTALNMCKFCCGLFPRKNKTAWRIWINRSIRLLYIHWLRITPGAAILLQSTSYTAYLLWQTHLFTLSLSLTKVSLVVTLLMTVQKCNKQVSKQDYNKQVSTQVSTQLPAKNDKVTTFDKSALLPTFFSPHIRATHVIDRKIKRFPSRSQSYYQQRSQSP